MTAAKGLQLNRLIIFRQLRPVSLARPWRQRAFVHCLLHLPPATAAGAPDSHLHFTDFKGNP